MTWNHVEPTNTQAAAVSFLLHIHFGICEEGIDRRVSDTLAAIAFLESRILAYKEQIGVEAIATRLEATVVMTLGHGATRVPWEKR